MCYLFLLFPIGRRFLLFILERQNGKPICGGSCVWVLYCSLICFIMLFGYVNIYLCLCVFSEYVVLIGGYLGLFGVIWS